MKELTKCWKFLLIGSIIVASCTTDIKEQPHEQLPMSREDSIVQMAKDLNIEVNENAIDIHNLLAQILEQKTVLIDDLDSIDYRLIELEERAEDFKKKEDEELRRQLLAEAIRIKQELKRIEELTKGLEERIVKKDSLAIPEKIVPKDIKSFDELQPGNYTERIDKQYVVSIYVNEKGELFFSQPKLDSVTKTDQNKTLGLRIKRELNQIKSTLKEDSIQ